MGSITTPLRCLPIVAVSSRHPEALDWARQECVSRLGEVALASEAFEFTETSYYASSMGTDLRKQFLAFATLIDPGQLVEIKCWSNQREAEYLELGRHPEARPINLDPGYLTLAKLVLASTKDHAHRIYLGDGIHGEVTLNYRHRQWQSFDWTYPDYQRADYHEYFSACRALLRQVGQ